MRTLTIKEQDRYIRDLAQQVMNRTGITNTDFLEHGDTSYEFSEHIHGKIWGWVMYNLTNYATLGKVISCAVNEHEVRIYGQRIWRKTPIRRVSHEKMTDMNGLTWMRFMATWTLCAAIYDILHEFNARLKTRCVG